MIYIHLYLYTNLPQLTMGLHVDNPIESLKYSKLKIHLIHQTYRTSELSQAHRKHSQNTYISLQLGTIN